MISGSFQGFQRCFLHFIGAKCHWKELTCQSIYMFSVKCYVTTNQPVVVNPAAISLSATRSLGADFSYKITLGSRFPLWVVRKGIRESCFTQILHCSFYVYQQTIFNAPKSAQERGNHVGFVIRIVRKIRPCSARYSATFWGTFFENFFSRFTLVSRFTFGKYEMGKESHTSRGNCDFNGD